MAISESPSVASLRQEIERKYKEALAALEVLSGYIGDQAPQGSLANSTVSRSQERPVTSGNSEPSCTAMTGVKYD